MPKKLLHRDLTAVTLLGFASGLPLLLIGQTLQAWYTVTGHSLKKIGLLSLIGLPYLLKFIWAPLLDGWRLQLFGLDARRSWLVLTQLLVALGLVAMAEVGPASLPGVTAALAFAVAFASATMDTAIDAWRLLVVSAKNRGLASALNNCGYRVAMIVGGGVVLVLADHHGWRVAYWVMGVLMALMAVVSVAAPMPPEKTPHADWQMWFKAPLVELAKRAGIGWIVVFIVLYKLPDACALILAPPFLLRDLGWSLTALGALLKGVGIVSMIIGTVVGGALLRRVTLSHAIVGFGWLHMMTILGYWALAYWHLDAYLSVSVVVFAENFAQGLLTTALIAWLMGLTNAQFAASQFALFSALTAVGRVCIGPLVGWIAHHWGWPTVFVISAGFMLPALWCWHRLPGLQKSL